MGSRSGKEVDFQRLADALADYRVAYLVTVDEDYRVHTVTVEPELCDRVIAVVADHIASDHAAAGR